MISQTNKENYIESVNPLDLSLNELKQIAEIEKDMWAHGIGEYVKCECCNLIFSKSDIFGHLNKELQQETVSQIERILGLTYINCLECNSKTEFLYDEKKYIENIIKRHSNGESFISLFKNGNGEIKGFFDGYMGDFSTIFDREFSLYYDKIGKEKIKQIIEEKRQKKLPKKIFVCSALGLHEKYKSFIIIYNLMKEFYTKVFNKLGEIFGIYESKLGTNTHALYYITGARGIGLPYDKELYSLVGNTHLKSKSDIFIHENVAGSSISKLSTSVKNFIRENREIMQSIIT